MRVLFVSSGNSKTGMSSIVLNQGESLKKNGINLEYFTIKGKGLKGYLKNIFTLKNYLKHNQFDIVHAHYSLTSFVASLAGAKPLVVSLMGSDVEEQKFLHLMIRIFKNLSWNITIVKSALMKNSLGINDVRTIPNGVDFDKFKPNDIEKALDVSNWRKDKKHILFAANPIRPEKNFQLAQKAFELITMNNIELHYLGNIHNEQLPCFFNSSNVVLLTSLWEGSPNVIKEAMACNCPIVSTDVGDVRWVFGNTEGCYITSYQPEHVAEAIRKALRFEKRTNGRERIKQLGLDSESVANKIISVYNKVLSR